jgi:hypothetical protein
MTRTEALFASVLVICDVIPRAGLPAKHRAHLELTDGTAASGLETKARRDLALTELGYCVLRLSYLQVMEEWERIVTVIRALVARDEHLRAARHRRARLGSGIELR